MSHVRNVRPGKHLRDESRRKQIINAARSCVARRGFHAASMAEIAASAGMSVGQIYRYFANKEAIIHAIVEGIATRRTQWLEKDNAAADVPDVIATRMLFGDSEQDREERILMIEVIAEATRNPAVKKIFSEVDRRMRQSAIAAMKQRNPDLNEAAAEAAINLISAMFEGSALFRNMGVSRTDDATHALYRKVLAITPL